MPSVESMTDVIGLPVWMIGFFALVILVLMVIAVTRVGSARTLGLFGQIAGLALLVGVAWLYLDRLSEQDRGAYRRNIEARLSALTAQSLLPNSHLACLDAAAEDLVHEACEKALYSGAEQVSAALSFVGARLDVLRDIATLPDSEEAAYDKLRAPLVRAMQADRYGLVAQVLQGRDGCTADRCHAFAFLKDYGQLVANMKDRAYETRLTKHAANWSDKPAPALAAAAPAPAAPPPPKESQLNLNFPSSASIPPVSIMANEPGMPGQNGVDAPAKPDAREVKLPQPAAKKQPQKAAAQQKQQPQQQQQQRPAAPAAAAPAQPDQQADPFPQPVGPAAAQTTGGPNGARPQ